MSKLTRPIAFEESRLVSPDEVNPALWAAFDYYVSAHADSYKKDIDVAADEIRSLTPTEPLRPEDIPDNLINDDRGVNRIVGFDLRDLAGLTAYWHMRMRFAEKLPEDKENEGDLMHLFSPALLNAPEMRRVVFEAKFSKHPLTATTVVVQPIGMVEMPDTQQYTHLYMREFRESNHNAAALGREIVTIDPLVWAQYGESAGRPR